MRTVFPMLLIALYMQGQTQNYSASTTSFPNPERGFYHFTETGTTTSNYQPLSASMMNNYRNENVSVIMRNFYLSPFVNTAISADYLAKVQADFNVARNAGLKILVRFSYSNDMSMATLDASKTQILAHIAQMAPIIQANKDVIAAYQLGWIGCWGEEYYTSHASDFGSEDDAPLTTTQWNNRKEIVEAMLNSTPVDVPIQVRTIAAKQKMYPAGNSRIGFFNDAFLDTWGDAGTYTVSGSSGTPSAADISYVQAQTALAPMSGETDNINSPRTDCANAMAEMDRYNWSLVNKDYLTSNISNWTSNGCYSEMEKKLGYRFELLNATISNNTLTLKLQNSGYANVYRDRKAYLVLRNSLTGTEYPFEMATNLRQWLAGAQTQIVQSLNLAVPIGTYQLYLNLPDPNTANKLYSIECANTGTWDATKGYNNLNLTYTTTGSIVTDTSGSGTVVMPPVVVTTPTPTAALPVQIILQSNNILAVSNLPSATYTVAVYNTLGKLKSTTLSLQGLKKGIYIVKITCLGVTYTQQVSKGGNF